MNYDEVAQAEMGYYLNFSIEFDDLDDGLVILKPEQ
jgi:hypothetical protein